MHGVELVDAVIAKVRRGKAAAIAIAKPKPATLGGSKLTFPSGTPLSPALARWLAFDASWLGWPLPLASQSIGDYAKREYGMEWGYSALPFDGDCFGLRFGSDSRRLLYVGEPDSIGEHPVLLTDTDDDPYFGVEYPGIDVYLGVHSGVLDYAPRVYGDMIEHPVYGARMREHATRYFGGKAGRSVYDLVTDRDAYNRVMDFDKDGFGQTPVVLAPVVKAKPERKPKSKPKSKSKTKPKRRP
jgi:hypothetical protein